MKTEGTRWQKLMAQTGRWTRHEADRLLAEGQVAYQGKVLRPGDRWAGEGSVVFQVGGEVFSLDFQPLVYGMLHKPPGYLCSRRSQGGKPRVYDLSSLKNYQHLATAGRLDFDSEGLLILSNDGEWLNGIIHPRFHLWKIYEVQTLRPLCQEAKTKLASGFFLEDGWVHGKMKTLGHCLYQIQIVQGRKHLVKRLCLALGSAVCRLVRVQIGPLSLPKNLAPGKFRLLTVCEKKDLDVKR